MFYILPLFYISYPHRDIEGDILKTARELGVGIVCYSPLGRGFLSGKKEEKHCLKMVRK